LVRYREPLPGRYALDAFLSILSDDDSPVEGATVEVAWTLPDSQTRTQERLTGSSGWGWFRTWSVQTGTYQVCVTDVSKSGYLYDPGQNNETCDWITVP
jgi:hypothetical protein